jgi:hypothetical protein
MMLTVSLDSYEFNIEHKTGIGNLTELWAIGNAYRERRGNPPLNLEHWLRRPQTEEFVRVVEYDLGIENTDDFKSADSAELELIENPNKKDGRVPTIKSPLIKTKRGRYGGTWAHLYILLDAAMYLDAKLRLDIIKIFIEGKLLEWRDKSGNEFISLNITMDTYIPGRDKVEGDNRKWLYINVAKKIKEKILQEGEDWNNATPEQLELRTKYERELISFLRMELVRDEQHLFELINKLKA